MSLRYLLFDVRSVLLMVCGGIFSRSDVPRRYKFAAALIGGIASALLLRASGVMR